MELSSRSSIDYGGGKTLRFLRVRSLNNHDKRKPSGGDETPLINYTDTQIRRREGWGTMRRLIWFVLIMGVVGSLSYGLPKLSQKHHYVASKAATAPEIEPRVRAEKKSHNKRAKAEKAALIKVVNAAVAARHGGVLPKTMPDEDRKVAAQAAIKWKAKQAADTAKR
jgi:hypothetical protein